MGKCPSGKKRNIVYAILDNTVTNFKGFLLNKRERRENNTGRQLWEQNIEVMGNSDSSVDFEITKSQLKNTELQSKKDEHYIKY